MVMSACLCRPCHDRPSKMIEAELFFHLLMGLLTNPARLEGGGEPYLKIGVRRKIRQSSICARPMNAIRRPAMPLRL